MNNNTVIPVRQDLLIQLIEVCTSNRVQDLRIVLKVLSAELEQSAPALSQKISILAGKGALRKKQVVNPHPIESYETPSMLIDASKDELITPPVLTDSLNLEISEIINEHENSSRLLRNNLLPVSSLLFEGPPGVGKTYLAKWLAKSLNLPIYILDLASVMNSHLGKTGSNIKEVFDFASKKKCVLLLDEFDSIAKKRDDDSDIGELKRLVTVLLQALDGVHSDFIVIAATNHSELLDPAVWRRFEKKITFDKPDASLITRYIECIAPNSGLSHFTILFKDMNFSDISYNIKRIQKAALLSDVSALDKLIDLYILNKDVSSMELQYKKSLSASMVMAGMSQRDVSKKLSLSRPTIKKELEKVRESN